MKTGNEQNNNLVPAFSTMIAQALGSSLTITTDSFAEMFAEDGVMEFPFAPPSIPDVLEGRSAIANHLKWLPGLLTIDSFSEPQVHRSEDGKTVILEFNCIGKATATGKPYNQSYVSIITMHNGRIQRYRDYWNPLVTLSIMDNDTATAAASETKRERTHA